MKIRILENSVRLRLTQTEVKQLTTEGIVRQTIMFGLNHSQQLNYAIQKKATGKMIATYEDHEIIISVPDKIIDAWANSEQVSVEAFMPLDEKQSLKILVEKDFKCLTVRAGEDESDMFPNPDQATLNC